MQASVCASETESRNLRHSFASNQYQALFETIADEPGIVRRHEWHRLAIAFDRHDNAKQVLFKCRFVAPVATAVGTGNNVRPSFMFAFF